MSQLQVRLPRYTGASTEESRGRLHHTNTARQKNEVMQNAGVFQGAGVTATKRPHPSTPECHHTRKDWGMFLRTRVSSQASLTRKPVKLKSKTSRSTGSHRHPQELVPRRRVDRWHRWQVHFRDSSRQENRLDQVVQHLGDLRLQQSCRGEDVSVKEWVGELRWMEQEVGTYMFMAMDKTCHKRLLILCSVSQQSYHWKRDAFRAYGAWDERRALQVRDSWQLERTSIRVRGVHRPRTEQAVTQYDTMNLLIRRWCIEVLEATLRTSRASVVVRVSSSLYSSWSVFCCICRWLFRSQHSPRQGRFPRSDHHLCIDSEGGELIPRSTVLWRW